MEEKINLSQSVNDRHALRDMMESNGWAVLMGIAEGQTTSRSGGILLQPLQTGDAIYEQEFAKGEIAGIKLFQNMPQNAIEALTNDIATAQAAIAAKTNEDEEIDDGTNSTRNAP